MTDENKKSEVAKREEEVLVFWNENDIFKKSLNKESPKGEYVFYDGPPFATGLPHHGSLLSSVIKDVVPRYQTMRGFRVNRRWGWDTHGLPIESLVEKELGLKSKKDILEIGIKAFNEKARSMVLTYVDEWEKYVVRVGRWVDYENSYKTMDNSYIESVWWALKELWSKKRLYEGKKVLMYCPHCETPLAKAEIAMDDTYKDVTETAVTAEFRVKGEKSTSLLAWTTTPWTLPGNVALAVGDDIDYVVIEKKDEGVGDVVRFILAKERLEDVFGEDGYSVVEEKKGKDLVGLEYEPLFNIPAISESDKAHKVYSADFVTTGEGTGIVHTAVMYGEDDFELGKKENLPMVQLLNNNATYNEQVPEFIKGQHIKKAGPLIIDDLEKRSLLFESSENTHSYPHCYRCGTPLIYNALSSWFIDIQSVKEKMLEENEKINWIPEHLKDGRFKHIVENAPDWTISRNRFWASPLPIWKCESCAEIAVIGSALELRERATENISEDLDLHRPYIDDVKLKCSCGAGMTRIPEVVDCWVESGSMPFAQNHKLGEAIEEPVAADFIAEYIAQTRTWFYYMHAMGVSLFNRQAFKNVISTGNLLSEKGEKISKSKGNYTDPLLLIDKYGADAYRLYLMGSPVMQAEDVGFRDEDVREMHNRVINMFWNTCQFYMLFAGERDESVDPNESPHVLDKWLLIRLNQLISEVTQAFDAYTLPVVVRALREFIDDYSTWYVRRSRDRVRSGNDKDKQYTLAVQYEALITLAKLMAPTAPFIADSVYRSVGGKMESVHLEGWPESGEDSNEDLLVEMEKTRSFVSRALEQRSAANIKVRQPLGRLTIDENLPEDLRQVIAEEINVESVEVGDSVLLDTTITPELEEKGKVRDLIRAIQDARKEAGLEMRDRANATVYGSEDWAALIEKHKEQLMSATGTQGLTHTPAEELSVEVVKLG